jgi:serine/threonine-protein kinase HipA
VRRVLVVWWGGRVVGELVQDEGGDLGFSYGQAWLEDGDAPALSASLPRQAEPFPRRACRPFFGGLLPEEAQRKAAAQALGISAGNDFAMLDRLGGEVAGAIQFLPVGEAPLASVGPWRPHALEAEGLVKILDLLPVRPLLAGEGGLRLSLAGAQSKVPVVLVQGRVALPQPGQPTSHILKPAIPRFKATTENEAFAMRLAAAAGLEVAGVEPRVVRTPGGEARTFLLVERYDRVEDASQVLQRLHQEDFCQALGVPVERKYQAEGGPSLKACFALLRRVSARPTEDVPRLLDAVVFNLVVGNADAHGKNFSLLLGPGGPRLAPLYDLLSTVIYPELSPRFVMKVGRGARLEELDAQAWREFAEQAELGLPFVQRRVREGAARIAEAVPATLAGLPAEDLEVAAFERLAALVLDRSRACAASLAGR